MLTSDIISLLRDKLADDATLRLYGCNTGKGSDSLGLYLSSYLPSATVQAPPEDVRYYTWPRMHEYDAMVEARFNEFKNGKTTFDIQNDRAIEE